VEPIDPLHHPLLQSVVQGARWAGEDQFPGSVGPDLFEEWLRFIMCEGEFDRFRERLQTSRSAKHRNATFAEIGAAYFLKRRCGLPIIAWEPVGASGKEGEFLIAIPDGRQMFVEVKGPEWEAEIIDSEKRLGEPDPRTRPARLDQPKYVDGEAFFFAAEPPIFKAVEKAYPKLPDSMPTLLIISDDLRVPFSEMPADALLGAFYEKGISGAKGFSGENGCFFDQRFERLGAAGTLNLVTGSPLGSAPGFQFALFRNPNALPAVAVPKGAFAAITIYDGLAL
jgi:hypothetical protein